MLIFELTMDKKEKSLSVFVFISVGVLLILISIIISQIGLIESKTPFSIPQFVTAIISTVIAVIGAMSAYFAYRSARFTQRATQGELYIRMMERYTSKEMSDALRVIGKVWRDNKADINKYIDRWWDERENNVQEALLVENARHIIKYFYRDLMQICQANYFSRDLTKRICNTGGRHLFKDVILAMERKANPHIYNGEFDPFDEIYNELEQEQSKLKKEI
jgi:hypothetical protein